MPPITAIVITLDEAENIGPCIDSARQVCDEVIVVDSGSTDETVAIAEARGARVVHQPYLGDGPQKAHAVPLARHDWILSLDADERLDATAVAAIRALDLGAGGVDGYALRRKSFVGEAWVRPWYPDWLVRLYDRRSAGFEPVRGHARVKARKVQRLPGHILHYSYRDWLHVARRTTFFIDRGARQLADRGHRATPWDPPLHGLAAFLKTYLGKGGWRNGLTGLNVAVVSAYSAYMKYAVLRERQLKGRENGR